jgi:hypothetical protein
MILFRWSERDPRDFFFRCPAQQQRPHEGESNLDEVSHRLTRWFFDLQKIVMTSGGDHGSR